jgi:protein involved in polysaccharide export with SLBB domain
MSIVVRVLNAWVPRLAVLGVALGIVGCAGSGGGPGTASGGGNRTAYTNFVDILRPGDLVEVRFSGNPSAPEPKVERIKDDGTITLPFLTEPLRAAGKTAGDLQREIHDRYVPNIFRQLTVTVGTDQRVFFVDGEVKDPGRIQWYGQITVLGAIAAAGGFTDFAARGRVELTRLNGEYHVIDATSAKRNPALDLPVIPGDKIYVPRRSPFGRGG